METWTIQTDGSATEKVGGAGVVLISPEREISLAKALRAKNLIFQVDSQLIIG